MELQTTICLIIFIGIISTFALNKIPMAATAMIGMMLMLFTGCLDSSTAMANFSAPSILLLGGMFVISGALGKTQIVKRVARLISRVSKGSFRRMLVGYVILTMVINELISSSSACFSIVWPLVLASCREEKISPSKMAFPIGLAAICAVGWLPTAGSIAMCETYRRLFVSFELAEYADYTVLDYCLIRLPVVIITLLYVIFYVPKHLPEKAISEDLVSAQSDQAVKADIPQLTVFQEYLVVAVFAVAIIGIVVGSKVGIPGWQFTVTGALILVAAGVMRGKEVYNNLGLGVLFLIIGGSSIASALQQSGVADVVGNMVIGIFGENPNGYLFGAVFFVLPCLLTQVMSDGAVAQIFVPIALMASKAVGGDPFGPVFLVITGSLAAYLTPMANPTSSLFFNAGGYDIKDIAKISWIHIIPLFVIVVLWVMTLFPLQ